MKENKKELESFILDLAQSVEHPKPCRCGDELIDQTLDVTFLVQGQKKNLSFCLIGCLRESKLIMARERSEAVREWNQELEG